MRLTYIRTHTHITDEDGARVYTPPARFETILYVYIYMYVGAKGARDARSLTLSHTSCWFVRGGTQTDTRPCAARRGSRARRKARECCGEELLLLLLLPLLLSGLKRGKERETAGWEALHLYSRERERASAGHPTSSAVLGPRVLWYNTRSAAREWGDVKVEREGQVERSSCSLSFRASEHGARRAEQGEKKGAERAIGERPRERGVKRILARSPPGYTYTLLVSIFSSAGILMARELARLYLLWLACSDRYTPFRFSLAPGLGKFVGCCALRACSSREDERRHEGSKVLAERDNGSASVRIVVVLCALMWRLCGYRRSLRIF